MLFLASVAVIHHFDWLGKVAYALERGRLQADVEHLHKVDAAEVAPLEQLSHAFTVICRVTKPSVVNIEAVSSNQAVNKELERLYGRDSFQPFPLTGTGSGIIFDTDGHIVTNNHVIEDADVIRVTLADGRRYQAKLIGTDTKTDIAMIKIDGDKLIPAAFGDSDAVEVGNIVLAIGSPFRLGHSVSHGIISAVGRYDVNVDIDYQNWLQTDAPINPGNSGGPLINTHGEVIGINTAIATETGSHQGVGFAIPSNAVKRIAEKLKAGKGIVRGYLGVVIQQVDSKIADAYGLKDVGGVLVADVASDGPAGKAGLKAEDIVMAVNGKPMRSREQLQQSIAYVDPDETVKMTIWRQGKQIEVPVKIGAQPDGFSTSSSVRDLNRWFGRDKDEPVEPSEVPQMSEGSTRAPEGAPSPAPSAAKPNNDDDAFEQLGLKAETVSPALAKKFRLEESVQSGALITAVAPAGEAYAAMLRPGMVIIRANGRAIHNARELRQIFTPEAITKGVRLKVVQRDIEKTLYTVLQVR